MRSISPEGNMINERASPQSMPLTIMLTAGDDLSGAPAA